MNDVQLFGIVAIVIILLFNLIYYIRKCKSLEKNVNEFTRKNVDKWIDTEKSKIQKYIESNIKKEYELKLEEWESENTITIRQTAINQSKSVSIGQIGEQLAPYFPNFTYNPKDIKFIVNPIDMIVFDGLIEGYVNSVIFLEIKSKNSKLNKNENLVKDAILSKRIDWQIYRIPNINN